MCGTPDRTTKLFSFVKRSRLKKHSAAAWSRLRLLLVARTTADASRGWIAASFDSDQLDGEDERGQRRNDGRRAPLPVGDLRRDGEQGLAAWVERFGRRGTEPNELFRSVFGQNFFKN